MTVIRIHQNEHPVNLEGQKGKFHPIFIPILEITPTRKSE